MPEIKHLAKQIGIFFATLFVAATCFFVAPNNAQAGQFEVGGAFGYAALPDSDSELDLHGLAFSLSFGYKFFDWLGAAVEQDLGGLFYDKYGMDISEFSGATIFEAKFYVPIVQNFEFNGKFGIGATYVANDGHDSGWFAIRLGVGATYYIMQQLGIGLIFDYTPSVANSDNANTGHFLKLQLGVVYRF